ncbi:MAG: nicotinate (nicotinamide) nucleotide adenylyltransferase [Sulfurovum sp.]|nr:nicotinate (nicotinamide) nucleotide adenylyltransferase [Sulfurovum sp.]
MVNQSQSTVAFYGGSFDPPHLGHQKIVQSVIEKLDIDKLLVVPAYVNPFKDSTLSSATTRLKWCHQLFDTIDNVIVKDYEIQQGKSTVTSQSVKHFNQYYTVKYLVIGSDNLKGLTQWHNFSWLNDNIIWVVITRDGYPVETQMLRAWEILEVDVPASSSQIRDNNILFYVDKKIKKSVQNVLKGQTFMTIEERVKNIVTILDDKKADEIEVFNLEDADYIAKRVVIANSLNGKHTLALFDHLKIALKAKDDAVLASDVSDDWVVADLGDILIHVMVPEYRQRYSLEQFLSELVENQKKNKDKDIDPA